MPKYVRGDNGVNDIVIIFPEFLDHAEVFDKNFRNRNQLVSAGFFRMDVIRGRIDPVTYGNSRSLNVLPIEGDEKLISRALGIFQEDF